MNKLYITLIVILFSININFAQSNFSNGFNDGYKKGYCQNQGIGCLAPIPPISPIPNVNENMNSYQDGYNRGFEAGLNAQKNNNTNTETRQRYETSRPRFTAQKVDLSENHIYNPYENQNTLNLAVKVAELKAKRINELYEKGLENYNNDNYSDAIYYANEIIKIEPNISKIYALKAMSQIYTGEFLNSFNNINKAKNLNYSGEDNITYINKEVWEYLKNQMANQKYFNVIDFCKNSWYENNITNYFFAMSYYYNEDYKNAKKYFKKFDFEPSKKYLDAIKENKILPSPFLENINPISIHSKKITDKLNELNEKNEYEKLINYSISIIEDKQNSPYNDIAEKNLLFALTKAFYFTRKSDECILYSTKYIDINNNNGNVYYFRGLAYSLKNNKELACKDFDKAFELITDVDTKNKYRDMIGNYCN